MQEKDGQDMRDPPLLRFAHTCIYKLCPEIEDCYNYAYDDCHNYVSK